MTNLANVLYTCVSFLVYTVEGGRHVGITKNYHSTSEKGIMMDHYVPALYHKYS